nr:MAG TPA: Single strand binding protein [Caudoviricetes sp.]
MNSVQLLGRLTKDPDITYTNNDNGQMAIARFTLAINRIKRDEADFIRCVTFGKTAEVIEKYVNKGDRLAINGHIQTGQYTNREGQTVFTTEVIADRVDLIESKENANQSNSNDGFMDIPDNVDDSGLPFNFG